MTRRSDRPRQRRCACASGFTLVELMVAVMVMTVGILGLASTAAVVMRTMSGGRQQTVAASVVASRFEQLRNQLCSSVTAGTAATRGITESWTVSAAGTKWKLVVDSVSFAATSRQSSRTHVYRSYVPCR